MGVSIASILAHIPGWEGASATRLSGGLTNDTWLVEKGDARAVVKADSAPRRAPYNSRPVEASIQAIASEQGLAPRVLHAEEGILVTEFVAGEVWQPAAFSRGDNMEKLAAALRRLHALPLTGRSFDSRIAARRYLEGIGNADAALAADCRRVIEAQPLPHNLCVCHNDLVAANILSAEAVLFLDWEYACDNDPFFDLATIVEHHALDDDLAIRLLDAYFDGDGRRWLPQLRAQQTLYAALYWMWLAARPDSPPAALEQAASRLRR